MEVREVVRRQGRHGPSMVVEPGVPGHRDWAPGALRRGMVTVTDVRVPYRVAMSGDPMDPFHQPPPASETAGPFGVDVDAVIADVIERLPAPFRDQLGSVAIVVEDEATPEQLARLRVRGLFGLYEGVPRTRWGVDNAPVASKITLFLGPLARANPSPERLSRALEATLHHEIAHHLGIDDGRLRELAAEGRHGR